MATRFDAAVVGGGPAGLTAACLLAASGARTALMAGPEPGADPRTVALMQPALEVLARIGVWPGAIARHCAPLQALRIADDTGALISAPEVVFQAAELGLDAFGWNVPLAELVPVLRARAVETGVEIIAKACTGFGLAGDAVRLELGDGALEARVAIAADGRDSLLRERAGIAVRAWDYDQSAIATSFSHSRPHRGVSTEYHRAGGPFTTVPLPDQRSSLVWMERPARAAALIALDDAAFAAEIQAACHGELGRVFAPGPRRLFAMRGLSAQQLTGPRLILIGETAHTQPPIGAQGLNMSIADAAEAARLIGMAVRQRHDPGGAELLEAYTTARKPDIGLRQAMVDTMNRSLLAGVLPLDAARALGLAALKSFGPLRRQAMRRGLGPA